MNVKNKGCIRRLSFRQLKAARVRNVIAILAIAMTALLFTSLFTIAISLNSSYEENSFRQAGGYNHGTFKKINEEQVQALSTHRKIKEYGQRIYIGSSRKEPFAKISAEVSWMDDNTMEWSYITPTTGRVPQSGKEIAMDTAALTKLGVPQKLGEEVTITFAREDGNPVPKECTDTFTLVGFWDYDQLCPVHFLNISREYVEQVEKEVVAEGGRPFPIDLNVMLDSSVNIQGVMEAIDRDLGYQWEDEEADNYVSIGVNWGYMASQLNSNLDFTTVAAIAALIVLVVFTGYLIIYNIFRISVTNDIRFYGLLKTIGATPRQLRRLIRHQALILSAIGIPLGLVSGYGVGMVLAPVAIGELSKASKVEISASPLIFVGAALFALVTVLLSCARPGRMAARISPVEAVRYTEGSGGKQGERATRGARVYQMAFANLGRSRTKTALVIVSLSLSVVLLNFLYSFTNGFDMEKYLGRFCPADFVVGTTQFFNHTSMMKDFLELPESVIADIQGNTQQKLEGVSYKLDGAYPACWLTEEVWRGTCRLSGAELSSTLAACERRGNLISAEVNMEGVDEELLGKLTVVEGDLTPLTEPDSRSIAICLPKDDYGKPYGPQPEIGSKFPVTYVDEREFYDSRTGEPSTDSTPSEYVVGRVTKSHDVEYTVCATVIMPSGMSLRMAVIDCGYKAVLPVETLRTDSQAEVYPFVYLFDTPDEDAEAKAEAFLAQYTGREDSGLGYESKGMKRNEFENFRNMFLLLGTALCAIVALVGVLNFFNAIFTGILTRRREFAMLQSVGMTGKQLKAMLMYEGLFYALGTALVSLTLALAIGPLFGNFMERMLWFFSYRFTILPVVVLLPVFALFGVVIPQVVYHFAARRSIVERLREFE